MSKILVTGGAGFIGSHLCERLLTEGHEVICLDNFNHFYDPQLKERNIAKAKEDLNFTLIRGDILDTELLNDLFSGNLKRNTLHINRPNETESIITHIEPPEVIIHLAALAGVRTSIVSPTKYVDVDIRGTVNLLELAKEYQVKQFIFGSSSSVYGINQKIPFSESDQTDGQVSPYGVAKRAGELYCKTYHYLYGIPMTILRFFTVYGPRQRPDMAVHKFTKLMSKNRPIPMYGDGTSERDYTYIDDCIAGIIAALNHPFEFEIFNLGNSTTVKLKDLIDLIAQKLDVNPKIEKLPVQPGDVPITYADISKARQMLGYNPITVIEEGVERFVRWYSIHRNRLG